MASVEAVPEITEPTPPSPVPKVPIKDEAPEVVEQSPAPESTHVASSERSVEPVIDAKIAELQKEHLFAEICSFFNFFAGYLTMKPISFTSLEEMFCLGKNDQIKPALVDLHLTLLRKVGYKSARADRWESVLQKFLTYIKMEEEALQLERLGYADLPLVTKLEAMFHLCGWQFDSNVKFKENIFNTLTTFELRLAPVGRDMNGLNYWFQRDFELNIRIYTEEPEDNSGGTWKLVALSHNDLIQLLNNLRSVDFNRGSKESSAEVDEEQAISAVSTVSPSKALKNSEKSPPTPLDPDFWKLTKPEVAQKYYTYLAKRNSFFDKFRDGSDLNKKKNEKLAKKAAKLAVPVAGPPSKQSTPKPSAKVEEEFEEPEIPSELLEDRRILPRRTARNAAISNLKTFSTPTRVKKETNVEAKRDDTAEPEASDNEDDDGFEDDDESDRSLGSSDEEFNLPGRRGRGRQRRPRRPRAEGEDTPKPKKRKKKPQPIAFESSDDDEGDAEEEVKERKKATSQSRCQACEASTHWEVLLLCDMCDSAWHTFCLKPQLWYVPDDDWFCPMCQHAMLVDRLTMIEKELCDALKIKETEDAKKKLAAERLKREMEYIGISLNNVVSSGPSKSYREDISESEESEESEDDGQRKSKKRALKRVMPNNRQRIKKQMFYGPVVTVAEGRSRRSTKKVDYNFSAYDEQLQEAMDTIDEPSVKTKYENDHRPAGGAGRGKDMANIVEAERKRRPDSDDYEDENDSPVKSKKRAKTSKRLTDLNIDDATESETDEYRASDGSAEEEPSEEDYVPSDEERRTRRSGGGGRRSRRSDEDFIDDSDSDYNPSGRKRKRPAVKVKRRSGRKNYVSDESEEEGSYASESEDERPKKKKPKTLRYDESSEEEASSSKKKTAMGRPMRRAAAKAVLKESDEDELAEDDDEEGVEEKKKEQRPVGALNRRQSKGDDADEFKPDDEEDDEEEEEEEEEEDDEDVDEELKDETSATDEEDDSTQDAPTMVKKSTPTKKTPPARRAPSPPPIAKKLPPPARVPTPTPPPKKESTPVVAKEAVKSTAPEPIHLDEPSTSKAPPPMSSPAMAAPVPLLPSGMPAPIHSFAPPPSTSTAFYGQPGPSIRFPQHGMYGAPPPGVYYPGMPMNYAPHPQMMPPGYVMQPPPASYGHQHPGMLQPQFGQSSMTMLEPMHSHLGPPPPMNSYSGLQPIQLTSQPSDADGLAQAITGALNDL